MLRPLCVLSVLVLGACGGHEAPPSPAPAAPEPPPTGESPAPPQLHPHPYVALEVSVASLPAAPGEPAVLHLRNASAKPYTFTHAGGSSGCDAFFWKVTLVAEDGSEFTNDARWIGQMCAAVMIDPQDITIESDETVEIAFDPRTLYDVPDATDPTREPTRLAVPPGTYTVEVGPSAPDDVLARTTIELSE